MTTTKKLAAGRVEGLWRYPVKSMLGEGLTTAYVNQRGLLGDRAYAFIDSSTGKLVSAKNPRRWPNLFEFKAAFFEQLEPANRLPPVAITLPGGEMVSTSSPDVDSIVSNALGRDVTLTSESMARPCLEEYWPDIPDIAHRDAVTVEEIMPGTFFDGAPMHLVTTATLAALSAHYPEGQFEAARFRPNLLINAEGDARFAENEWIGKTIAIGSHVRLEITRVTGRCVMTTLPQAALPRDLGILRAAAQWNQANVGVYATVSQGGTIAQDDPVWLLD